MTLLEYFLEHESLGREWAPELNSREPDGVNTRDRKKLWWRCEAGHTWQATAESRAILQRGCPYCAGQLAVSGSNDLATLYPEKAAMWHPEKNGPLRPQDYLPGSHSKVWWRCARGHSWEAKIYSVVQSDCGCPYCSGLKVIPGENDLQTLRPEIAALWDPERNGGTTPRDVSPGSKFKAWWRCEKGHSWQTVVYSVAREGCGCPYCAGFRAIPGETDIVTLAPEVAQQWDPEKNGGLDPRTVMPSSHEKVWWRCELGHSWQAAPYSRTKENGAGCPYCTGRRVLAGFNDLATLKPGLAEEWYYPLNGELKPTDVTLGSNKKVWWRCSEHHVWQAWVYARTRSNGTGCPVCAGVAKARKIRYFEDRPKAKAPRTKAARLQAGP